MRLSSSPSTSGVYFDMVVYNTSTTSIFSVQSSFARIRKINCNEANIEHARLLASFERHFSKLTFNYYNQANLGLFLPSNRKLRLVSINIVPGHLIHISMVA
jgi:hypothetical protein